MSIILANLQHIDALGFSALLVILVLLVASLIISALNISKLIVRYIFDGADARTPCLFSIYVSFIFGLMPMGIYLFVTGTAFPELVYIVSTFCFFKSTQLLNGRLMGFPFVKTPPRLKNALKIVFTFLPTVVFSFFIAHVTTFNVTIRQFDGYTLQSVSDVAFSVFSTQVESSLFSILMAAMLLLPSIVILLLDVNEKRSKKTVRVDSVNIALALIFSLCYLLPKSWLQTVHDEAPVAYIVLLIIVIVFFFIVLKREHKSIIKHSSEINVLLSTVKKTINTIASKKEITPLDNLRMHQISRLATENAQVQGLLHEFTISKSKRRVLREIREQSLLQPTADEALTWHSL
jgi:hypothetical protein